MRHVFFIVSVVFLMASCRKEKETLKRVTFSGSILDSTIKAGVSNVPVKLYWYRLDNLKETPVDSTVTDAQGNYTINADVNMSKFANSNLELVGVIPDAYASPVDLEHTRVGITIAGIQSEDFQLMNLYLFRKARLKVELNRTMSDSFSEFQLYYNYGGRNYWMYVGNNAPGSQSFDVITAAGVQTEILWSKKLSSGATIIAKDSIVCLPNVVNKITMNY